MQMGGEQRIDAPREIVWAALNDPDILRKCIPGCQSVDRISDIEIQTVATTFLGDAEARFMSRMTLSALDPPETYRITGESHGGSAGFARGGIDVRMQPLGATSTLLRYDVDAAIGGELARLDREEIDRTVKKMASRFFARLNETLNRSAPTAVEKDVSQSAPAPQGVSAGTWLAITLALITLALYLMALI
jgi:uncharacterized protein